MLQNVVISRSEGPGRFEDQTIRTTTLHQQVHVRFTCEVVTCHKEHFNGLPVARTITNRIFNPDYKILSLAKNLKGHKLLVV